MNELKNIWNKDYYLTENYLFIGESKNNIKFQSMKKIIENFKNYKATKKGSILISLIVDTLILIIGVYLVVAFALWSLNPSVWTWSARLIVSGIIFIGLCSNIRDYIRKSKYIDYTSNNTTE